MDDAPFVRGIERIGDLPCERRRIGHGDGASRQSLGERLASNQLQDKAVHLPTVAGGPVLESVDGADERMIQGSEHTRLALEAREAFGIAGHVLRQDLDGHIASELRVPGTVDFAHPAGTQQGVHLIDTELAADQRRRTRHPAEILGHPAALVS